MGATAEARFNTLMLSLLGSVGNDAAAASRRSSV
jgi:hypothetical protein